MNEYSFLFPSRGSFPRTISVEVHMAIADNCQDFRDIYSETGRYLLHFNLDFDFLEYFRTVLVDNLEINPGAPRLHVCYGSLNGNRIFHHDRGAEPAF